MTIPVQGADGVYEFLEHVARERSGPGEYSDAVTDDQESGNGADVAPCRQLRLGVDVDLGEDVVGVGLGDLV